MAPATTPRLVATEATEQLDSFSSFNCDGEVCVNRLRHLDCGDGCCANLETLMNLKYQQFLLILLGVVIVGIALVYALMSPWKGS